jgi:Bacteriophage head to tail connecting protein
VSDVDWFIKQQAKLEDDRVNFTTWWQQIAYRVMPSAATFQTEDMEGVKKMERLFTGKPQTNNQRFSAVLDDLLTPRSQIWAGLQPQDDELGEDQDVKVYLERLNKLLFALRYRPAANFASQKSQGYLSVGAFGNSCLFIDEEIGKGPRYKNLFMKEITWAENHAGIIDTVYRKYCMSAHQAVQCATKYGWQQLPESITKASKDEPFKKFDFLHVVKPNEELKPGRKDYRGMPWSSYYVSYESKMLLQEAGYHAWPFAIGRYDLAPNETYARSPAMAAWGAILTLNEEKKTVLKAGQNVVLPPLLLTEDGALEAFNMRSGALNHGAMSAEGVPLVQALQTEANIPLGLELMEIENGEIEDSFLVTIFKILTENPQMTATQVLEIAQQKATLLAPVMGRQQSEDLGPMIARDIDIASRMSQNAWILEEMPDALRERGGSYQIEYRSPLARAMRAQDGVAIMRTFEALPAAQALDPHSTMVIDIPASVRELAEINGVPAKLIRDKKMVEQMAAMAQQQAQVAQMAAAAPGISQAALNATKADQIRAGQA